jgi:hypothetical protein
MINLFSLPEGRGDNKVVGVPIFLYLFWGNKNNIDSAAKPPV